MTTTKAHESYPCPQWSPWDAIQTQKEVAPGIWSVTTAGHGGYWLSPQRLEEFRKCFPTFGGYAGLPWLEEDCDWALAALAFPEAFGAEAVFYAVETVRGSGAYLVEANAWLESFAGKVVREIAEGFRAGVAGKWRRGSCGTTRGGGWYTDWHRGTGDKHETRTTVGPYESANWLTSEELAARAELGATVAA